MLDVMNNLFFFELSINTYQNNLASYASLLPWYVFHKPHGTLRPCMGPRNFQIFKQELQELKINEIMTNSLWILLVSMYSIFCYLQW